MGKVAAMSGAPVQAVSEMPVSNPFILFLRRPMNWFLLFIPITVMLEHIHGMPPPVEFFSAALAIVPIAALIAGSTEQLSTRTGDAIGGLLNATFGNAPELIIALVALNAGLLDMVRASLAGAILANLLMVLGMAFLLGGLRFREQRFNPAATRAYSTMMFVAAVSMTVPSAYNQAFSARGTIHEEEMLNIGIAILLLIAYALYLFFSLKTHPHAFASVDTEQGGGHDLEEHWSVT